MSAISIIGCAVGVIGCIVGVATFVSAQVTKAKQDGVLIAKIDQCVKGIEDIKTDMKETNKEVDTVIDEHTREIVELRTQMKEVFKRLNIQSQKER